jgi:hypothetical protein
MDSTSVQTFKFLCKNYHQDAIGVLADKWEIKIKSLFDEMNENN